MRDVLTVSFSSVIFHEIKEIIYIPFVRHIILLPSFKRSIEMQINRNLLFNNRKLFIYITNKGDLIM